MRVARFLITDDLLRDMLHLPPETGIECVRRASDHMLEVTVTHPDFPDVNITETEIGLTEAVPLVEPHYQQRYVHTLVGADFLGWTAITLHAPPRAGQNG